MIQDRSVDIIKPRISISQQFINQSSTGNNIMDFMLIQQDMQTLFHHHAKQPSILGLWNVMKKINQKSILINQQQVKKTHKGI